MLAWIQGGTVTGWSVTKTDKILGRLALSLDLVQQTAPVAAKRANCASVEADGLRRGRDGVGRSTETPDPTAAAALSRGERDEVADLWRAACGELGAALTSLSLAGALLERIFEMGEARRGRENSVSYCLVCVGPAVPSRRGMCDACRKAHGRAGKPVLVHWRDQEDRVRLRWDGIDPERVAVGWPPKVRRAV